jgi:hypothetical protein
MDAQRRQLLATTAMALLPELERAIVESWQDLLPAASAWTVAERGRARAAIRAVLEGISGVIAQGDLDDRSWERVRLLVLAHGKVEPEEAEALVRTVRVPGVELLLHRLDDEVGLNGDERWTLQVQVGWFCDQLTREREDLKPDAMLQLLADLERDGPDMA